MDRHDYYSVLGVERTENARGIRDAFRELLLRHRPELTASESASRLQAIVRAHRVLSDARARASYDRGLEAAPEDLGALAPVRPVGGGADVPLAEPISLLRDFHATSPSVEEIFERLLRNFSGVHVPKSERLRPLDLDLILSRDAICAGGSILIAVPVFDACEICQGSGRDWLSRCLSCGGTGMVEREEPVRIGIPTMVHSDSVLEIPIRGLGIHNLYLRVRIRISD